MKILVIGGSYFFGRLFVQYVSGRAVPEQPGQPLLPDQITVVNRGSHPLKMEGVREWVADRHDREALASVPGGLFDVVVDFCAYQAGDVTAVCEALAGRFRQYLLVSTVDVLRRGTGAVQDENAPYEERSLPGEAGVYIAGKIALERELRVCAAGASDEQEQTGNTMSGRFEWTIVRPAILYGPYNYAPREGYYMREIAQGHPVYCPDPSDGRFQFVYAPDAVKMLYGLCGQEESFGQVFHLCADEYITYAHFFRLLAEIAPAGTRIVHLDRTHRDGIYFPFPVDAEETELYSGEKIMRVTGIRYCLFDEKMRETLKYFLRIYRMEQR